MLNALYFSKIEPELRREYQVVSLVVFLATVGLAIGLKGRKWIHSIAAEKYLHAEVENKTRNKLKFWPTFGWMLNVWELYIVSHNVTHIKPMKIKISSAWREPRAQINAKCQTSLYKWRKGLLHAWVILLYQNKSKIKRYFCKNPLWWWFTVSKEPLNDQQTLQS